MQVWQGHSTIWPVLIIAVSVRDAIYMAATAPSWAVSADIAVDGQVISSIGKGLLILVGIDRSEYLLSSFFYPPWLIGQVKVRCYDFR